MKTEYEVKVLDINVEKIKNKLKEIGARYLSTKNQRRYIYFFNPHKENSWIRLRDTGEKVTLTIKEALKDAIDGVKELEIEVDDFKITNLLMKKLGYIPSAYQENRRESYKIDGIKIEIDSWPRIPTYLEIEGNSVEEVEEMIEMLKLDKNKVTSVTTSEIYKKYGIDLEQIKELKF